MNKRLQLRVVFDRKHIATRHDAPMPREGLIQIEIRYNGKLTYIGIGKCYKDQFGSWRKIDGKDKCFGEHIHDRVDAQHLNQLILDEKARIVADFDHCAHNGIKWNADRVKPESEASGSFIEFARGVVGSPTIAKSTSIAQRSIIDKVEQSGKIVTFADLTIGNITALDDWLRVQISKKSLLSQRKDRRFDPDKKPKPLSAAYIHNVHSVMNKCCNIALRRGYIAHNPYNEFSNPKVSQTIRQWLSADEVELLWNYTPNTTRWPNMAKARDMFLIQCYTGLAHIDLVNINWDFARTSNILQLNRHKTKTPYIVRLHPRVIEILHRYDYTIPYIDMVSYNRCIAIMTRDVGVKAHITSHCARHTFATTFGLNAGVPIEVLARMLGHKNIQTTQIYAKMLPATVIDAFDIVDAAINKKDPHTNQ